MRRALELFAVTLVLLASARPVRAQSIVAHQAAGPAQLDGPWLLYEGDPPNSASAASDPRPARTYWLGDGAFTVDGAKVVWLCAAVTAEEQLSNAALLVKPNAADCQVFVNGQKAVDCSNWPRTNTAARRWLLVHVPPGPAEVAIRIVGPWGGVARLPATR